jgi:hypothetical protein
MDPCKMCTLVSQIPWEWLQATVCVILTILVVLGVVWLISKWESISNLFN